MLIPQPRLIPGPNRARLILDHAYGSDHRIRRVGSDEVRYFGLSRTKKATGPLLTCDLPGLTAPGEYIIEATDRLGEFPAANLMTRKGARAYPAAPTSDDTAPWYCTGPTTDGLVSINGQGPSSVPQVVASSEPFTVTPGPSVAPAGALLYEDFATGNIDLVYSDAKNDRGGYTLTTPTGAYDLILTNCNMAESYPRLDYGQLITVCSDGGTPGASSQGTHVMDASIAIRPRRTFTSQTGLRLSVRVPTTVTGRRWVALRITPSGDPSVRFAENLPTFNASNRAVHLDVVNDSVKLFVCQGFDAAGKPVRVQLTGATGQGRKACLRKANGLGIGLASTINLSLTPGSISWSEECSHFALGPADLTGVDLGWLFTEPVTVELLHYNYHQMLAIPQIRQSMRYMAPYWCDLGPDGLLGDQREWSEFMVVAD